MKFTTLLIGMLISTTAIAEDTLKITNFDYKKLYSSLIEIHNLKQGEFEKSKSFEKRVCQLTHQKINLNDNSYIVFPINIPRVDELFYYNADKAFFYIDPKTLIAEQGMLWMEGSTSRHSFDKTINELVLYEAEQTGGNYVGSNSFGINKEVNVKFHQALTLSIPTKSYDLNLKIKIPLAQAKTIKSDLRLAVKVKLDSPCFEYSKGKLLPKIDNPQDITLEVYKLNASKKSEWIVYTDSNKKILEIGKF